ncbi:MAG TPA: autotransporter-associated beta strand repeat-containing protein [Chthoniobacteraceae bacterium]|nr:autotransporter-associated beta strand repeat-containing protein [Chthoniobacteraceae bacterium]
MNTPAPLRFPPCLRTGKRRPTKALVSSIAALLAGASAHATVVIQNESNATNLWTLPVGTNILAGTTTTPSTAVVHEGSSSSWATLTDGFLGDATDKSASVTPDNGNFVVFSLDLSVNFNGYSLSSFDTYCAWPDSGRDNQNFTIQYATVAAPTTFLTLASVSNQTGGAIISTHTNITDTTGTLATGVGYIRFNFAGQENGYVGLREFIVLGTASPLSTPLTWSGAAGAGGNATWVSTPDSNWKKTSDGTAANYDSTSPLTFDSTGANTNITVQAAGISALSMTFTNDATKAYTFSGGSISTGNVILTGAGSVTFNAANSIANTTVNSGTLNVGHNGALGGGALATNGGTVNFLTAAPSLANLSGLGGTIVLGNTAGPVNTTLTVGSNNSSSTFAGVIAQAPGAVGSLTKVGTGTLTLSGANTYTGNTAINGGSIVFEVAGTQTILGSISGVGSITKSGPGSLTLTGVNSYAGTTTVTEGTLNITNSANTATGELAIRNGATLNLASFSDYGVPSAMGVRLLSQEVAGDTGSMSLHFTGGTLQYTGSTPQSTNRQIRVGVLGAIIDASGSVPGASLSLTHSGANVDLFDTGGVRTITLTGTNTGNNSFSISLQDQSGLGTSLAKTGPGTWLISGPTSNTNANGTTSVIDGILSLAKAGAVAVPGALTIGDGINTAVLRIDSAGTGGNQIADNVVPTFFGSDATAGILRMNNRTETIGGLNSFGADGIVENESGAAGVGTLTINVTGVQNFGGRLRNGDGVGTDGTLALTKTGAGTQILSGINTHTGPTTISGGTLTVDGSLGAGTTVTVGGNAILDGGGTVSGPVNINTNGTLSGAGTYTGIVSVGNGGTLGGTGTLSTVNTVSGSRISPGGGTNPGTLSIGTLTLASGSVLDFEFGAGGNDLLNITNAGGLTINGGAFNLFATGGVTPLTANGTYNLIGYTNSFAGLLANLTVGNSQVGKFYSITDTAGIIRLTLADAAISEWNGGAANGLWTTSGNWTGGTPNSAGAVAKFGSSPVTATTVAVDGGKTVGGILLDNVNGYTLTGGALDTITFSNGVAAASITVANGNHTIAAPLVLSASGAVATTAPLTTLTISANISGAKSFGVSGTGTTVLTGTNSYGATSVGGGVLQIGTGATTGSLGNGDVTMSSGSNLVFNRSDDLTVPNNIFGAQAQVTKRGAGTLTLTGNNSFGTALGGGLNLNAGTVKLGSAAALGIGVALNFDGGQLDLNGNNVSAGALVSTASGGTIRDTGAAGTSTLAVEAATDSLFSGSIVQSTRTIALAKSGPGALTVSGNNSFTGGLAITNGAIIAAGAGGNVPIVSNVTLGDGSSAVHLIAGASESQFGPNTSVTFNNGSKDAKLMLRGTSQTLAGVDGTVGQSLSIIQNDEAGTPGYVGGAGLATLTLNTATNHSFAGLIRNLEGGGLNIVKEGPGTQELINVLVATSQYGDITINDGKLSFFMVTNGVQTNQLGTGNIFVNGPGTLVLDGDWSNAGNTPFVRVVSGTGSMIKQGPSTVNIASVNSYTGGTAVNSGTLLVTGSVVGTTTVNAGGTLGGAGTVDAVNVVGGTLAPGNGIGTLTTGSLTLNSASILKLELTLGDTTIGGGINDLAIVNGNLTLDGTLQVAELGGPLDNNGIYTLIDYSGTLTNNGLVLDSSFLAVHPGAAIIIDTLNTQVLLSIPEPASVMSILSGVCFCAGLRRRRRNV